MTNPMPSFLNFVKPSERNRVQLNFLAQECMSEKPYFDVGQRLRWHRESLGLRQKDYAASVNAKRAIYSLWESGASRITIDTALALCDKYGLSMDFIYSGKPGSLPETLRNQWLTRE